ncbi:3-phosphoshikimate 1-carboxyvinyltransferase [Desulfitispora alkaliphila]|uniref:3-phosphoshikimate 1-carboxyvinyltransferase n=1 Tax=Desulfitispora alkaliphila TaxID=622674 RepID=UPI003D22C170
MKAVTIKPWKLKGVVNLPPSKSISHRAIISASLSEGTSVIDNLILSKDMEATISAMRLMGSNIEIIKKGENDRIKLVIGGGYIKRGITHIDCIESGSTLRFLIPVSLLDKGQVTFHGRGKLVTRPLDSYYEIFHKTGIKYSLMDGGLPLTIDGQLESGTYELDGNISSQFVSGLMFSLPLLSGDSKIIIRGDLESKGYVDLTLDVLKGFGIRIANNGYKEFTIEGNQKYKPSNMEIEGDYSQAAFWLAAGVLGEGVESQGIREKTSQGDRAIVNIIEEMGGKLHVDGDSIKASPSSLNSIKVDVSQCPDLVPIIAVLGTFCEGVLEIGNGSRVRIKESDRLKAISTELNKLGADITETEDGLIVKGVKSLRGGEVDSWNDHRIVMALAIAATRASGEVTIRDSEAITKSYPGFWEDFKMLGGIADEWQLG